MKALHFSLFNFQIIFKNQKVNLPAGFNKFLYFESFKLEDEKPHCYWESLNIFFKNTWSQFGDITFIKEI